jgi:uncharacterized protein (UPF0261 family)
MAPVVLVGTLDTKGEEHDFLRDRLREQAGSSGLPIMERLPTDVAMIKNMRR